jgi:hypothetical protein
MAAVKTMHFDLHKQRKRESALFERVRAMGDHYASACLGRGHGVRYRGDVGEREMRNPHWALPAHQVLRLLQGPRDVERRQQDLRRKECLPRRPARFPWSWRWCRPSKG